MQMLKMDMSTIFNRHSFHGKSLTIAIARMLLDQNTGKAPQHYL